VSASLIARRLANHGLDKPRFDDAARVLAWYGAVQGQEFLPAKWGVAQRTKSFTNADLDRAFDEGRILRTHLLRPTWHLVAPADIRWIQMISAPRVQAFNAYWYRVNELTPRMLARGADAIARALEGGTHLTRPELSDALRRARIKATGTRLACIVMHAELEAIICSGPRRGKLFTYALLDERAPAAPKKTREEALAELTTRYFRAHGPAMIRDFMWWSSLRAVEAREGVALAGLVATEVDGLEMWSVPGQGRAPRAASSVRLLPIYDEYFVAYKQRRQITTKIEGLDMFANHLVADGKLIGSWRAAGASITLRPHTPMDERHDALAAREVKRYRRFMGIS
jgi:hypothetical protein